MSIPVTCQSECIAREELALISESSREKSKKCILGVLAPLRRARFNTHNIHIRPKFFC